MKKYFYFLFVTLFVTMPVTLASCGGNSASNQEESAKIEQVKQDSINQANGKAERIKKEQEEQARLEAEREAKIWKGVSTLSELKSKLPGTVWGATRKRGDFYFKFEIKGNQIITTAYINSDFSEDSKFSESSIEIIDSWKELDGQNAFTVTAYEQGADKDDWATVPTMLAFRKGKPDAQWATIDGIIPLKQLDIE